MTVTSTQETVLMKKAKDDHRKRVLFLTSNPLKKREYQDLFENTYGASISFREPPSDRELDNEVIKEFFAEMDPSPHFVLREATCLFNVRTTEILDGKAVVECPEEAPKFIDNKALLTVWIPIWNADSELINFKVRYFEHTVHGYIDPQYKHLRDPDVFGWDHLFVNPKTGRTYLDHQKSPWGKVSARQLVLDDFIKKYFLYEKPHNLKHNLGLTPKNGVEISHEMSVGNFIKSNRHLSNPHMKDWGLDVITTRVLNEGVFFKAGTSRPMNNYFTPPFAGVPITPKKSEVEETVFMMHDFNHHNIPDLIFDGDDSAEMLNVYVVWRMMSEALTLVMADMFYADTLYKSDPANESSLDSRIYPLFKALNLPEITDANRETVMKQLLYANAQYAVLGNEAEWEKLVRPGQEARLDAYKNHFAKFFIGDHVWSKANFLNMASVKDTCIDWVQRVGPDQFKRAGLIFIRDIVKALKAKGTNLLTLKAIVPDVFAVIMETRLFPKNVSSAPISEDERLSKAFHRYMIGQMSFYSHFKDMPGIAERGNVVAKMLADNESFPESVRDKIYTQYLNDVRHIWAMGVITGATADNYAQIHPIFPPVYVSYKRQSYKTIQEVLTVLYGDQTHG